RRIFTCYPDAAGTASAAAEHECAREILSTIARRAYRGSATPRDLDTLLAFYEKGYAQRGFEGGIQTAIERVLASPKFTFRAERDPESVAPGAAYPVSGL